MAINNLGKGIDDLIREARKNTLNKRINYKGNYENYITGGSKSLNNQAKFMDSNEVAEAINNPESGWKSEEWLKGTSNRYANPQHDQEHLHTPSTKRGRRLNDIFFHKSRNDENPDWRYYQDLVDKYEGRK